MRTGVLNALFSIVAMYVDVFGSLIRQHEMNNAGDFLRTFGDGND